MESKWLESGAKERVKQLLEQAGIPLEIRVRNLCNKFCQSHNKSDQIHVTAKKVVYESSCPEGKYREIDQRVQIYEEFGVDELTGIQLIVNLPIECKYRAEVEAFGFPTSSNIYKEFVISGSLAGSRYFSLLYNSYSCLSALESFDIVLARIEKGKTPKYIHKENLIYNTAGSLYDFVLFDLEEFKGGDDQNDSLVEELFEKFRGYLRKHHYYWSFVWRDWIDKEIKLEHCERFNQKYFGGSQVYHSIIAHLPIVCINGPLYHVKLDSELNIEDFEEVSFLTTSIQKHNWPGSIDIELLRRDPLVPVVVTNLNGLNDVLKMGFEWHQEIKKILQRAPRTLIKRWALESTFFRKVYSYYKGKESHRYRSDLAYPEYF